ncbi:MAG TPA: WbqC family protein [Salinivirgaceae bacterium]|nr:WbqC family protein [Salinivirgaceae bacterium]HQA75506.1 WbqC family protein [Salinivirgaceae bacterium]
MKKGAILQSNYIPWKGYFDIIRKVDVFIFYDDVQYTKRDWRSRNKIKTSVGAQWLTIPCGSDERRLICDVVLNDTTWQKQHWQRIEHSYKKAPFFNQYKPFFEEIYLNQQWSNLSDFNQFVIKKISKELLGINTKFEDSRVYNLQHRKGERIIELLLKAGIDYYVSGPAAKDYITDETFHKENIAIEWMDYSDYPEYNQLYPPFDHYVSIIDLIFNEGSNAINYMKSI